MKFTKLSLIAALAVTTAMAGDAKISGDAKLFYSTSDAGTNNDLFGKSGAMGDTALSLDYTRDVLDGVTLNAGITGISTLGLEDSLVSDTWVQHNNPKDVQDAVWIDTLNIIVKPIDKTMLVLGRQALDTPLAFTETWNIAHNTFDAAVAVDNHIPKTTLIGAWVGRGNGQRGFENINGGMAQFGALSDGQDATLSSLNGSATPFMNSGAYAAAVITKAIPMTTTQAWYYNVKDQANAYWLQADVTPTKELSIGLQHAKIMPKAAVESALPTNHDDTSAVAGKIGYEANGLTLAAAYSEVDDKGLVYMGNTATGGAHGGQSKLYTEAWWNYNFVGQAGAKTAMVSAAYDMFTAQYTTVSNDNSTASNVLEMDEVTLTATKKVGPVDATVAFINTSSDDTALDGNTVQAYLTVPFSL